MKYLIKNIFSTKKTVALDMDLDNYSRFKEKVSGIIVGTKKKPFVG